MSRISKHLRSIAVAWALASCFPPNESLGPVGHSSAQAAPSPTDRYPELAAEFAKAETHFPKHSFYPEAYHDAKLAAALELNDQSPPDIRVEPENWFSGKSSFDIDLCVWPLEFRRLTGRLNDNFEQIASSAVWLERKFEVSGYQQAVYRQPLLDYERRLIALFTRMPWTAGPSPLAADQFLELEAAIDRIENEVAADAESRRSRLQPEQPEIAAFSGCGGGEDEVYVRTNPPGGRVWTMTAHAFYRCALRTRTPWSRNSCRWIEVHPETAILVSGRLFFQARWPDGRSRRGSYSFRYMDEQAATASYPSVVTVTP